MPVIKFLVKLIVILDRQAPDVEEELEGANFGFWSHLGCSRQNAIIFSRNGLF